MTDALLTAAYAWWRMKRPAQWTVTEHVANPTINCRGPEEHELAKAVADSIKNAHRGWQ